MCVRLGVWFFDLQAGETEKGCFGTDAKKYIDEVKKLRVTGKNRLIRLLEQRFFIR
jgi:hypothetical protein